MCRRGAGPGAAVGAQVRVTESGPLRARRVLGAIVRGVDAARAGRTVRSAGADVGFVPSVCPGYKTCEGRVVMAVV